MERSEAHSFPPIAKSDPMPYRPVADPNLQIGERGGGGGGGGGGPQARGGGGRGGGGGGGGAVIQILR